jgi:hypothetical protein
LEERHRWEDNIKWDFKETRLKVVDPVVRFCEHGIEPSDSIRSGEFLHWLSLLPSQKSLFPLELAGSLMKVMKGVQIQQQTHKIHENQN